MVRKSFGLSGMGYENTYNLHLADGQCWQFVATEGIDSWVERLASLMELKRAKANGHPKLIYMPKELNSESHGDPISRLTPEIRRFLPPSGWTPRDLVWLRIWSHRDTTHIICEIGHEDGKEQDVLKMRMSLQPVYKKAQDLGGLPLHAALIEREGSGILLVASSGKGKSTSCRRIPKPWRSLCDEEALILRDDSKGYLAHPFPTWSEYIMKRSNRTWNTQHHLPLSAIFFLEKAESENALAIGKGLTAVLVHRSAMEICHRNLVTLSFEERRIVIKKLFDNACELARKIPAFKLRLSLNGRFWEEMEKVLP